MPVPEAASPLGQDPAPVTPVAPTAPEIVGGTPPSLSGQPAPEVNAVGVAPTPALAAPTQITLTPEEHNALLEKANVYDTIAGDETASGLVRDHFAGRRGEAPPAAASAAVPPAPGAPVTREEYDALQERYESGQQVTQEVLGRLQIAEFERGHPDLADHRHAMGELMKNHNMPMQQAYDVARAMKAQQPPPSTSQPAPAVVPTSEGRQAAPMQAEPADALKVAEAKINDRNATPRIDDAFDIALAAAIAQHPDE